MAYMGPKYPEQFLSENVNRYNQEYDVMQSVRHNVCQSIETIPLLGKK